MALFGLFSSKKRLAIEAFGGDIRPAVKGPGYIQKSLTRQSFIRTLITSFIIVVSLAILVLAIRAPGVMDTQLFISDGSAFGCFVRDYPVE